jgi:hypothetical protein
VFTNHLISSSEVRTHEYAVEGLDARVTVMLDGLAVIVR